MSDEPQDHAVECPLCHAPAVRGTLYGTDHMGSLQWFPGPPSWKDNLASVMYAGRLVGKMRGGAGAYIEGIRCKSCKRLILDEGS